MSLDTILQNPVDRQILDELQAKSQKHVERADQTYQDLGTVKIFSVGPVPHVISLGGLGMFTVPACPKDRIYSVPLEIWKLYPEGYNVDMNKMKEDLVNGWAIAESIVGYGKQMNPTSNMTKIGIFTCGAYVRVKAEGHPEGVILASELKDYQKKAGGAKRVKIINDREVTPMAIAAARKHGDRRKEEDIAADIMACNLPTEAELDEATGKLQRYCTELVNEANGYYRNNDLREIQAIHRWAGEFTGQTNLPWMQTTIVMSKCENCGNPLLPDVIICLACHNLVPGKEEIAKQRRLKGFEYLWADKTEEPATRKTKAPATT